MVACKVPTFPYLSMFHTKGIGIQSITQTVCFKTIVKKPNSAPFLKSRHIIRMQLSIICPLQAIGLAKCPLLSHNYNYLPVCYYTRPQPHKLINGKKTEGPVILPPLHNSPKLTPLKKKYPTATKTLISEFADGLLAKGSPVESADRPKKRHSSIEGSPKHQFNAYASDRKTKWQQLNAADGYSKRYWSTPADEKKTNSVPHLQSATGSYSYSSSQIGDSPRTIGDKSRLSWKTVLEDAGKLDGYKQMYASKKKRQEIEVSRLEL
jgi:hypothetical protein